MAVRSTLCCLHPRIGGPTTQTRPRKANAAKDAAGICDEPGTMSGSETVFSPSFGCTSSFRSYTIFLAVFSSPESTAASVQNKGAEKSLNIYLIIHEEKLRKTKILIDLGPIA